MVSAQTSTHNRNHSFTHLQGVCIAFHGNACHWMQRHFRRVWTCTVDGQCLHHFCRENSRQAAKNKLHLVACGCEAGLVLQMECYAGRSRCSSPSLGNVAVKQAHHVRYGAAAKARLRMVRTAQPVKMNAWAIVVVNLFQIPRLPASATTWTVVPVSLCNARQHPVLRKCTRTLVGQNKAIHTQHEHVSKQLTWRKKNKQ